jgi:signal transduction histidine kinase
LIQHELRQNLSSIESLIKKAKNSINHTKLLDSPIRRANLPAIIDSTDLQKTLRILELDLDEIMAYAQRLRHIMELLFSKEIDSKFQTLSPYSSLIQSEKQIDLVLELKRIAKTISFSQKNRHVINIKSESSVKLWLVPELIEVVFGNLFSNAQKYATANSIILCEIKISIHAIYVYVKNKGPKIEPDELSLVFKEGYRSKNAMKTDDTGQGLGLYIARSAARQWGGDIKIDYDSDQGLYTFTVIIPRQLEQFKSSD